MCAFLGTKSLLDSALVLAASNFSLPFMVQVDASTLGAGAVLLQDSEHGLPHPLGFFSMKSKQHQLN